MFSHPMEDDAEKIGKNIYPGLVINNDDPSGQQRIQCRVSVMHRGIEDAHLPWCLPLRDSRNSTGSNVVGVPMVGSNVTLYFPEDGNEFIYYVGTYPLKSGVPSEFQSGFPNVHGFIDQGNNLFIIDNKNNLVNFVHGATGTQFQITSSSVQIVTNSVFNIKVNGDFNVSATGNINLKGSNVNLNPSSTAADGLSSSTRAALTPPTVSNLTEY